MKVHLRVEGEGASLAIKSNLKPTYMTLQSGEHCVELDDREVMIFHDARHDPNFPTHAEEVSNLPPGIVAVGKPQGLAEHAEQDDANKDPEIVTTGDV